MLHQKKYLDNVIKKCSNILQFSKESSFVDDALYMIGVSYYYKQNYSRALRKFRELEAVPESDLALENKLWTAKTELQLRNYDTGLEILQEVKEMAREQEREELLNEAYMFEISLLSFRENYLRAIDVCNEFLEFSDSDEEKAKVAFQLGKLNYGLNKFDAAAVAFKNVMNYSPEFEVEFLSKKEYAVIQTELGNYDDALAALEEMKFDDKFIDNLDVLDLELGKLHRLRGEIELAEERFIEIDTVHTQSDIIKEARYNYAVLLENELQDYDSSLFFYDKALKSRTNTKSTNRLIKDKKEEAITNNIRERIKVLNSYFALSKKVTKFENQLVYIDNPAAFVQDSIDYHFEKTRYDSLQSKSRREKLSQDEQLELTLLAPATNTGTRLFQREKPEFPTVSKDSVNLFLNEAKYELGNMFFVDLDYPDSSFYYYNQVLEEDSIFSFTPNVKFALASYYSSVGDEEAAEDLYNSVYSEYQGSEVALQAGKRLGLISEDKQITVKDTTEIFFVEAENEYLLGNLDIAIEEFYALAENSPDSYFAPKALFAAGWILEKDYKNYDSAAVVYDTLVSRYANSEYAKKVQRKLSGYKKEMNPVVDSLAVVGQTPGMNAGTNLEKAVDELQENAELKNEVGAEELPDWPPIADSLKTIIEKDTLEKELNKSERIKEMPLKEKTTKTQADTTKPDNLPKLIEK